MLVLILLVLAGSLASLYGVFNSVLDAGQTNSYPPHTGRLMFHDALCDQNSGIAWQEGANGARPLAYFWVRAVGPVSDKDALIQLS